MRVEALSVHGLRSIQLETRLLTIEVLAMRKSIVFNLERMLHCELLRLSAQRILVTLHAVVVDLEMVHSYRLRCRTAPHAPDKAMVQQLVGHHLVIVITQIGHLLERHLLGLVGLNICIRIFVLYLWRAFLQRVQVFIVHPLILFLKTLMRKRLMVEAFSPRHLVSFIMNRFDKLL